MRSFVRVILIAFTVLSTLLCVAALAMWGPSYSREVAWTQTCSVFQWRVASGVGRVDLLFDSTGGKPRHKFDFSLADAGDMRIEPLWPQVRFEDILVAQGRVFRTISVGYPLLIFAFALPPMIGMLYRRLARRHRLAARGFAVEPPAQA